MNDETFDYRAALNYLYRGGDYNGLLEMHHPIDGWVPVILDGMIRMKIHAAYRLKEKKENQYTHEEIMTKWFRKKSNTVWSKFTAFDESRVVPTMYEFNHTYWISYNDICREFVMSDMPR